MQCLSFILSWFWREAPTFIIKPGWSEDKGRCLGLFLLFHWPSLGDRVLAAIGVCRAEAIRFVVPVRYDQVLATSLCVVSWMQGPHGQVVDFSFI